MNLRRTLPRCSEHYISVSVKSLPWSFLSMFSPMTLSEKVLSLPIESRSADSGAGAPGRVRAEPWLLCEGGCEGI